MQEILSDCIRTETQTKRTSPPRTPQVIPTSDPEATLLIPVEDVAQPELSIVIPALNEQLTIADFIQWCKEGMTKAGVVGEILIIDSSTDRTSEIAVSLGARVLKTPKRGLGRAYIDALPHIRGKYILMGDCDCTYDFRELKPFVEKFREGYEFVMGSRFKGYIEPEAMPPLHQYLGTPVTTWILNVIYSSKFSDIHCGMRGMTKDALARMDLRSQSWQYASEIVLKSVHMELKTAEVPIRFLKDREGRLSHHKRSGWFSPWQAAWINLQAMFVYGPDFFLYKPGILLLAVGLLLMLPLSFGPVTLGSITFSLYWMLLGLCLSVVGLQAFYMGVLGQVLFDFNGQISRRWLKVFSYNRSILWSVLATVAGTGMAAPLLWSYVEGGFRLSGHDPSSYMAVTGLFLLIGAFINFTFTLLLHATEVSMKKRS